MNNTYYLFRHGLATTSNKGYQDQIKSAQLLPKGIQQAQKIGEYLKTISPDAFFSSEYVRCKQTADIISRTINVAYQTDSRLNEYDAISFPDFVSQITSFSQELSQNENQKILICSHAATLIIFKKILFRESIKEEDIFGNDPPTGVLQIVQTNTIKQIDFNREL